MFVNRGGLGDTIARLPAVKYALDNAKHIEKLRLICQEHCVELVTHFFKEYGERFECVGYDALPTIQLDGVPASMTDSKHHTTLSTHITDHAFHTLCDVSPLDEKKSYLRIRPDEIDLTEKQKEATYYSYIVITTGFTAGVREWLPGEINKVAAFAYEYLDCHTVFLGKGENTFASNQPNTKANFRSEEIDFDIGFDLRECTTLLQAAKIMSGAKAVLGVDNGLLHLAATSDVPIIAGYTTVDPQYRLPYRYGILGYDCTVILPEPSLGCRLCQNKLKFVYNFDFRTCYYGDYECVRHMTGEKFIDALKEVFGYG
jgi:ADP-heptose:LPS heptosyltransferase